MHPFTPPTFAESAFNCPYCNAYAKQGWTDPMIPTVTGGYQHVHGLRACYCSHCGKYSVWRDKVVISPDSSPAPIPNIDLPEEIRIDFDEARAIISRSPRGAAALFRLCIQKLCKHLGGTGKNINDDIAYLVSQGLNVRIQQSLDIVRVVGNEAVHPGSMDLKDNAEIALQLANLINLIADAMITQPKAVDALYAKLPVSTRDSISKRDAGAVAKAASTAKV